MQQRTSVRVLLVDDHSDTLEVLGQLMQLLGCQALACADSTRCIDAAKEFQPHVVLIDLGMPRMDGFTVALALRDLNLPPFMLIAFTGYADEAHRKKCADSGFDEYLVKPASFEQLCNIIDEANRRFCGAAQDDGHRRKPGRTGT